MDSSLDIGAPDRPAGGPIFARAFFGAFGRVQVWLFLWSFTLLLAAMPAVSRHGWLRGAIDHRYEPGSLAYALDRTLHPEHPESSFRTDFAGDLRLLDDATARYGAALAVLMVLFGVFTAGGWLQVILERTQGHSMRRFFFGGVRYFWRFFRLLLLTLLLLGLFGWVVHEGPWKDYVLARWLGVPSFDLDALETLDSEWTYTWLHWLQAGMYGLLVGLTLTWGDYTRTRMALHETRSAVGAGFSTFFTMLRHPVRTLRPMLLLFAVELIVIAGGYLLYRWVERGLELSPTTGRVLALFAIGQLVILWRTITRGARYHAAVAVTSEVVQPPARPDPWKSSIGGPGGPRYPLEGSDEYGVSL